MAIEANVDQMMARASELSGAAAEFESNCVRFKRAKAAMEGIGQAVTPEQTRAFLDATGDWLQKVQERFDALTAAHAATEPIGEVSAEADDQPKAQAN